MVIIIIMIMIITIIMIMKPRSVSPPDGSPPCCLKLLFKYLNGELINVE